MSLSRRVLLGSGVAVGLGGVAGLESGLIPGRARVHDLVGLTGPDGVVPDVPAGPVVSGTFESFGRRTTVGYSILYPDGYQPSDALPVVLVLHGRGGDHTSAVRDLGIDRYLTAAVQGGVAAVRAGDGGRRAGQLLASPGHRRRPGVHARPGVPPGAVEPRPEYSAVRRPGLVDGRVRRTAVRRSARMAATGPRRTSRGRGRRAQPGGVAALRRCCPRRLRQPRGLRRRTALRAPGRSAGCCRAHRLRSGRSVREGGRGSCGPSCTRPAGNRPARTRRATGGGCCRLNWRFSAADCATDENSWELRANSSRRSSCPGRWMNPRSPQDGP